MSGEIKERRAPADTRDMDFRTRERLVLGTGLAAAGLVAGIAGASLGTTANRFVSSVVVLDDVTAES